MINTPTTQTILNRIQSQMGLSDTFNVLSIEKRLFIHSEQPDYKTSCQIPDHWYLVAVQDQENGFRAGFVWLNNLEQGIN